jgi:hypothetical protein
LKKLQWTWVRNDGTDARSDPGEREANVTEVTG